MVDENPFCTSGTSLGLSSRAARSPGDLQQIGLLAAWKTIILS
jgi:hypothetical protein